MEIEMQRTFYPVGQGAFYSESFYTNNCRFNVVYDCGSVSKGADKVVSNSFDQNEDIDILFISHFDSDHVNKINILKNSVRKIKTVVMPLLADEIKYLLLAIYRALGGEYEDSINIINDPNKFFGDGVKIIWVKKVSEDMDEENDREVFDINEISGSIQDSGANISFCIDGRKFWVYKPYNYEDKKRYNQLMGVFEKSGVLIDELKNIDYVNNNREKIKDCYKKISGSINQNSLVLYSNLIAGVEFYRAHMSHMNKCCDFYLWYFNYLSYCDVLSSQFGAGSIYTGDVDLILIHSDFKRRIKQFKHYLPINTIQVPHHGSKNGFDIDFFNNFYERGKIISPISFGLSNSYGHPASKVVKQLISECHFPVYVTDDKRDLFTQVFNFRV